MPTPSATKCSWAPHCSTSSPTLSMSSPSFTRRPCQEIPFASHRCRLDFCAGSRSPHDDTARRRGGASCGESPSTATKHRVAAVGPGSTARWWQLTSHVARRSDWCHVATYADIWPSARNDRPGLLRLVGDAGPVFDLVVIDGYQRLALRRRDQRQITQYLAAARAALMVPSSPVGRRLAATLLNVALADLVCESAR